MLPSLLLFLTAFSEFQGGFQPGPNVGTRTGNSFNYIYNSSDYDYYRDNFEIESTYKDRDSVYRIFKIKKSMSMPEVELSAEGKTPSWIKKKP